MASASKLIKRRRTVVSCGASRRRRHVDISNGVGGARWCRRLDQCAYGIGMVRLPVRNAGVKSGAGAAKRKVQTAFRAGRDRSVRAARVISWCELNTATWIWTAVHTEWDWRSRATGSGGGRRGTDRSKGVAKRIGSGNPVARSAHVDSGWLRRGPSKHRKIGPIIAGSCQMEIHRANSHGSTAARVNLNRTRGASEDGD